MWLCVPYIDSLLRYKPFLYSALVLFLFLLLQRFSGNQLFLFSIYEDLAIFFLLFPFSSRESRVQLWQGVHQPVFCEWIMHEVGPHLGSDFSFRGPPLALEPVESCSPYLPERERLRL